MAVPLMTLSTSQPSNRHLSDLNTTPPPHPSSSFSSIVSHLQTLHFFSVNIIPILSINPKILYLIHNVIRKVRKLLYGRNYNEV